MGKEQPPIAHNLPPIAGALTWCRGLLERIKTPMAKIRKLDKSVMESEEARDVIKDYTAFQGQLSDYEREQIEAWGAEMEKSSQAKLKILCCDLRMTWSSAILCYMSTSIL